MKKIVSSEPMTLHQFNLEQNIPHISQPFSQGYKVVFEDGQELKVTDLVFAKNVLTFAVTIDGNDISVTGKVENAKITGKVNAPDGVLELIAEKKQ